MTGLVCFKIHLEKVLPRPLPKDPMAYINSHSDNRYCPSARESDPDVEGNVEGKGGSGGQVPVVSGRIIQHIQYPGHSASKPAHTSSLLPCGSRGAQHPGIDAIQYSEGLRWFRAGSGRLWVALEAASWCYCIRIPVRHTVLGLWDTRYHASTPHDPIIWCLPDNAREAACNGPRLS